MPHLKSRGASVTIVTQWHTPGMRRLLCLLFAVLVIAGCSGGGDDTTPFEVISSARATTLEADSAKIAVTVESGGTALTGGQPFKLNGLGAFDFEKQLGSFTTDLGSLGLPGASGKVEIILTETVVYVQVPGAFGALLGGKEWIKVDLLDPGENDLARQFEQLRGADPTAALNYLEGASANGVTEVGEAEVRGDDTTHYKLTVDLAKAKQEADEALRDDYDRLIEQLGGTTLPVEVWIDGDDRVRRMKFTVDAAPRGNSDPPPVTVTNELYDFGTEVEVTTPPEDEVAELGSVLGGLGG
jgi:hypothetical protein